MELRNGVYTSQTRADDARDIKKCAKKILEQTGDPTIRRLAEKIVRLARDLEDEL